MGEALDRDGRVLGEAHGETKREVFEQLTREHPDADEIRIKTLSEKAAHQQAEAAARAQKPSVGRIVLYTPDMNDPPHTRTAPLPAIVTAVHSDTCVNLSVFNDGAADFKKTSVVKGDGPFNWNWPPRV